MDQNSIVDFLKSLGIDSSLQTRRKLFQDKLGFSNYSGSAKENLQLLNALRQEQQAKPPVGAMSKPQTAFGSGMLGQGRAADTQGLEQAALFENLLGMLPFLKLANASKALPMGSSIAPRQGMMMNRSIRNVREPYYPPASPGMQLETSRHLGPQADEGLEFINRMRRMGAS